jgi:hypothetical protein
VVVFDADVEVRGRCAAEYIARDVFGASTAPTVSSTSSSSCSTAATTSYSGYRIIFTAAGAEIALVALIVLKTSASSAFCNRSRGFSTYFITRGAAHDNTDSGSAPASRNFCTIMKSRGLPGNALTSIFARGHSTRRVFHRARA